MREYGLAVQLLELIDAACAATATYGMILNAPGTADATRRTVAMAAGHACDTVAVFLAEQAAGEHIGIEAWRRRADRYYRLATIWRRTQGK